MEMTHLAQLVRNIGKLVDPLTGKVPYAYHTATNSSFRQCRRLSNHSHVGNQTMSENRVDASRVTGVQEEDFSTMLRRSKLFQLGHYEGKIVEGVIQKVVGDDLYIDFGGKFYCVCQKPQSKNIRKYVRGQKVRVSLQELELSTRFLGATKDITLCEADALLVGTKTEKPQI